MNHGVMVCIVGQCCGTMSWLIPWFLLMVPCHSMCDAQYCHVYIRYSYSNCEQLPCPLSLYQQYLNQYNQILQNVIFVAQKWMVFLLNNMESLFLIRLSFELLSQSQRCQIMDYLNVVGSKLEYAAQAQYLFLNNVMVCCALSGSGL